MQIRKSFTFEAAHVLPNHPGKCARLHGHSYRLDVTLDGPLQASGPAAGMVEDFEVVSRVVKAAVISTLDHRSLNELMDNPTAENLARLIFDQAAGAGLPVVEVVFHETEKCSATYTPG